MKEQYEQLTIETIVFENDDVITNSGSDTGEWDED